MKTMVRRVLAMLCLMFAIVATAEAQNSFAYQAVIRNAKGELVSNQEVGMQFSLVYEGQVVYSETHKPTTSQYGNIQVNVGEGQKVSGSFAAVPWSTMKVMMKIEVDPQGGTNYIDLGTIQLQPAPYAMYATEAGAVSTIQPGEPKSDGDALFEVKDKNGNVVFAVYPDGVRVFVDDADSTKAMRTGFAVAGRRAAKEGADADIFSVTADGTQVFVSEEDTAGGKAMRTGFAVSGRRAAKDLNSDLFTVSSTGTQIYINNEEDGDKAMRTGFAVAGRRAAKDDGKYLEINVDGTRVFIDDDSTENSGKAMRTGFAVAGRRAAKGDAGNKYMEISADGTQIYVGDDEKAMRTGFAVAGRRAAKGESLKLFEVNGYGTKIYIDETAGKAMRTGFAVAGRRAAKEGATNKYLVIDADGTRIYVDYEEAKAMRTGFAVAGRRAAKDGAPNTILTVDNVDGTRAYIDDIDGKAMRTGFAVSGRRAAKDGDDHAMQITDNKALLTVSKNLTLQDKGTEANLMVMAQKQTKIATEVFAFIETETNTSLIAADAGGVDVNADVVVAGDMTQTIETEENTDIEPVVMTAFNQIDTLGCGAVMEAKGYQLLKIYGSGMYYAPVQSVDADGNSYILFDANGNISTMDKAVVAVVMTNAATPDAQVLVWPIKQTNSTNISFGLMAANSTDQYVKVVAAVNAQEGVERKVEIQAENGSVEITGHQVYGELVTLNAKPHLGYDFENWNDGYSTESRTLKFTGTTDLTANFKIHTYNITVKAIDEAGNQVEGEVTVTGDLTYNSKVTLEAPQLSGYEFVKWKNGDVEENENPLEVTITSDTSFMAIYKIRENLITVNAQQCKSVAGTLTKSGSETTETITFTASNGIFTCTCPQGAKLTIHAEPEAGYEFSGWQVEGNTIVGDYTIESVTDEISLEAIFEPIEYSINYNYDGGSLAQGASNPAYYYITDNDITLAEPIKEGYDFKGWKEKVDDGEETENESVVIVTGSIGNRQYTAIWNPQQFEITTNVNSTDFGSVTEGGTFDYGSSVTITATAKPGYKFAGWYGADNKPVEADDNISMSGENGCQLDIEAVKGSATYIAVFEPDTKKLTIKISEPGAGTVTVVDSEGKNVTLQEPDGALVSLDGSTQQPTEWYADIVKGETVTLKAVANDGYVFKNWNGDQNLTTATINNIEISENVEYTANFIEKRHIEIAIPNDAGSVTASIDLEEGVSTEDTTILYADCEMGITVTLTATPDGKYKFKEWKVGGESVETTAEYAFTLNEDVRIVAVFEAPIIYVSSNGKETNSGKSANEPLPSIAKALNCIPDDENQENWMDWEIRIIGTLKGAQNLETEPIMDNDGGEIIGYEPIAAKSITIIGNTGLDEYNQPQDMIDGGWRKTVNEYGYETWKNDDENADPSSALTIKNVSAPVIIKNLAITGGYYETGGGMYVESSSKYATKVTIDGGTVVRGNKALTGGGVYVYSNSYYDGNENKNGVAEVTMNGGIIGGNSDEDANYADINTNTGIGGGGVLVYGDSAKFSMKSGSIKNNLAAGGGAGVCVYDGALFEMEAGTIEANRTTEDSWNGYGGGVLIKYNSKFIMNGGSISNNQAFREGGGVHVSRGTLEMSGESVISGNHASTGGGVYLNSSSTLTMTGGNIIGNVADEGSGVYLKSVDRINMSDTAVIDANNDVCLHCEWDKNAVINVGEFNFANENADAKTKVATITPAGYSQEEDFYLTGERSEFGRFDVTPVNNEGKIEFYTITNEGKLQKREDAALIAVYYDYSETSQRSELKTFMEIKPSVDGYINEEDLPDPSKTDDDSSIEYVFDGWYVKDEDGYSKFDFDQEITTTTVVYGLFSASIDAEDRYQLSDVVKYMDDPLTDYTINITNTLYGPQVIEQPNGHLQPRSITLRGKGDNGVYGLHGGWGSPEGEWEYWGVYSVDEFDSDDAFANFIKQPVLTISTKAPIYIENLIIGGGYSTGIYVQGTDNQTAFGSITLGNGAVVENNGDYYGNAGYFDKENNLACIGVDVHPNANLYMSGNARVNNSNVVRLNVWADHNVQPQINIDGLDDESDVVAVIHPDSYPGVAYDRTVLTGTPENIGKQRGRFKVVPHNGNQYGVNADGNVAQLISVTFKDGDKELTDLTQYVASGGYATVPEAPIKVGYTLTGWYNPVTKQLFNFSETQINEELQLEAVWDTWMIEEGGHYFVDLGTGDNTLWATTNVGAENAWDFGDYYAWGETEPRYTIGGDGELTWKSTYNGYDGTKSSPFEYYDVATRYWGESSSMPTDEQIQSLVRSGYWVWTDSYNGKGKSGFIVYKLKDGDSHQVYYRGSEPYDSYSLADVHIFLPAAGYYAYKKLYDGSEQYTTYWSKTTYWDDNSKAYTLIMYGPPRSSSGVNCVYSAKWSLGNPVRPVTKAKCTISFDSQGGNDIVPIRVEKGTVPSTDVEPTPERANKVFAGWYSDPDFAEANKFQFGVTQLTDDITLYAKWVNPTWMIDDGYGHYYVDLGIGALWATANIGSETSDYHDDFISWSDNLGSTWVDEWAAPTKAQFTELVSCEMAYTNNYAGTGRVGAIVYAKGNTDKSLNKAHIFIPFDGFYSGSYYENTDIGYYWTSEVAEDEDDKVNYIQFSKSSTGSVSVMGDETSEHSYMEKDKGLSVRLIRKKENGTSQIAPQGAINGKFSVGNGKQVYFSQGNLQYQSQSDNWKFADNQYEMINPANTTIGSTYTGPIDLFSWGTGNNPSSTDFSSFTDWGRNPISNGGSTTSQWRTLTSAEWANLIGREGKSALAMITDGEVSYKGLILLPDEWSGNALAAGTAFSDNTIQMSDWETMESSGAVFLPAAGGRDGSTISEVGQRGSYWSETGIDDETASGLYFDSEIKMYNYRRSTGRSVRLVQDVDNGFVQVEGTTGPTSSHIGTVENETDNDFLFYTIPDLEVSSRLVSQYEFEQLMTYYGAVNSEYAEFVPSETSEAAKKSTPAYYVSWIEAIIYCNLRSEAEGKTPVYKFSENNTITDGEEDNPWTKWGNVVKTDEGKYYYNYSGQAQTSYDLGVSFSADFTADGYRLPTTAEYINILEKKTDLITGEFDEWCENFSGDEHRCWYKASEKSPTSEGKYSNVREQNLGFRIVRNAPAQQP